MKNVQFQTSLLLLLLTLMAWSCGSDNESEVEPQLSVNVNELAVKSAGETVSVQVTSNVPYEVSLPAAVEWITHRAPSSVAEAPVQAHTFEVKPNGQYAERTATIRFRTQSTPLLTADVVITQMQQDAIIVAGKTYEAKPEGGRLDFTINTNVAFEVACSEAWIKPATTSTRALEEKTLSFEVEPNETGAGREATVTITSGSIRQEVKVTQARYYRDRAALMAFYKAAGGSGWEKRTNWDSDELIGKWYGIEVNEEGRVTAIRLNGNGLSGNAEDIFAALSQLECLRVVSLSSNAIEGKLPDEMAALTQLEWFDVMSNQLNGTLPDFLGGMQHLYYLNIYMNNFSGTIPESYNGLFERRPDNGVYFYVGYNFLTGDLPKSLLTHPSLADTWIYILPQYEGYGFTPIDLPAYQGQMKCVDGSVVDMKSLYGSSQYTLLFYWGADYGSSTSYIPRINALYERYGSQGLSILGVRCPVDESDASAVEDQELFTGQLGQFRHISYGDVPLQMEPPFLMLVDKGGRIVRFNCTEYLGYNTIPQFLSGFDQLLDLVARQFGDAKFEYTYYTSTDYSHEGEVLTLQKASEGKGINLVFVGEGFTDLDMDAGGRYEQVMQKAVDKFFAYEPYTSLRNRFSCYAVKAVSPNAEFAAGTVHAIDESTAKCDYYYRKAGIGAGVPRMIVVYNDGCEGRSYTQIWSDGRFYGFCMTGADDVLVHEVCGHGLANLGDEYVEPGQETMTLPQDQKELLKLYHSQYHWYENLDWRSDPTQVAWAHLAGDSRFAAERLGTYEGAFYYGYGAYRPTENSMMRYNDCGFNAASREIIYKRVMTLSEGTSWTYDYETFVAFDAAARQQASTRALQPLKSEAEREAWRRHHRAPVLVDAATGQVICLR